MEINSEFYLASKAELTIIFPTYRVDF